MKKSAGSGDRPPESDAIRDVAALSIGGDEHCGFDPVIAKTHVSILILAGDRAFKLKKPIRTAFLDFSSPELRRRACLREVELNRRFAPDVYLGVAEVRALGGEPCDYLVVMRRMPAERRLSTLARAGRAERCVEAVATAVAAFHSRAPRSEAIDEAGRRDAVRDRWEANLQEMSGTAASFPDPGLLERVGHLCRRFLEGRSTLFDRRIAEGRLCDGHGDLLADDIYCLDDGPRIIDCLEFDDRLRHLDVLDDAGFLAMDLERIEQPALAARFLELYQEASGDRAPNSLVHHYIAYRAGVRAKVALLRHGQGDEQALGEAIRLLEIALRHLEAAQVVLVLIGGLPGTGKSTLARGLAEPRGWTVLRTDEVRKQIADGGSEHGYEKGRYRPEVTEATYTALLSTATDLLAEGTSVVLDASWSRSSFREEAARVAEECSAELVALRCEVPAGVARGRLEERSRRGRDPSEATPEIAAAMASRFDAWPEAIAIDTSAAPGQVLSAAAKRVAEELRSRLP